MGTLTERRTSQYRQSPTGYEGSCVVSVPNFAQANQGLAAMQAQQSGLSAAVEAGTLWMEPDVAERAAVRCEQQIDEVEFMIADLVDLGRARRFGDNEDGRAIAQAFVDAAVTGPDSITGVLRHSQEVLRNMAATYRAAGRVAAESEEANQQMFEGRPVRLGAACSLALVWFAVAGCGQAVSGEPAPAGNGQQATKALAALDPCTLLADTDVEALGFRPDTRQPANTLGLTGCRVVAAPGGALGSLALQKEPHETAADYATRSETFGSFRQNDINGRSGAQVQVDENNTDCTQIVDAGSGSVQVTWIIREPGPMDPCAEALRVMQLIEPDLPAVGS